MPGPKSISLLPWQECGENSEARFYQLSIPPRDAESNRQRFYRNKFANSSDSLENRDSVMKDGQMGSSGRNSVVHSLSVTLSNHTNIGNPSYNDPCPKDHPSCDRQT
jgi:hypothetical protein